MEKQKRFLFRNRFFIKFGSTLYKGWWGFGGETPKVLGYLFFKYSSIAAAAFFPAPMARITVAAPVTASPPA